MAKKIYAESIKAWLIKNKIWVGGSGTLIGAIFLYLVMTGAISNYTYSGDTICAGTIEDPCYAYINFTANEDIFIYPINYDPYGRNTPFDFNPNVKSWKLQRSWGTGWRDIPLNQSCTGTWCGLSSAKDTSTYSMAFRKGKTYQVRIVGYKNNPYETVKWGAFNTIDPDWIGLTDITKTTNNEVFKELKLNDVQNTKAVFTLQNPMETVNIKREDIKVNFIEVCGHVNSYKLLVNSTCEAERIKETIYSTKEVCYDNTVSDNKTNENITTKVCNNETFVKEVKYENYTYSCFNEFDKINAKDVRDIKIDVKDIVWEKCSDGTFGYKIDWIPEITLDDTISQKTLTWTEMAWWNSTFLYRREINLKNDNIANETGIPVKFELDLTIPYVEGKINSSCYDLIITNSSDVVMPSWVQDCHFVSYGNKTIIWANISSLPGGANSTFYLYYGNAANIINSTAKGKNVFVMFDDFKNTGSTSFGAGWSTVTNTQLITNSGASLINGTALNNKILYPLPSLPTIYVVEFKTSTDFLSSATRQNDMLFYDPDEDYAMMDFLHPYKSNDLFNINGYGTFTGLINTPYRYNFVVDRAINKIVTIDLYNNTYSSLKSYTNKAYLWSDAAGYIYIGAGTGTAVGSENMSYFYVGAYINSSLITYTLGAEESAPSYIYNCSNLAAAGTYYLANDILNSDNSTCMNITANGITLDCEQKIIDGNGTTTYGIYSSGRTGVTIKNCIVTDFNYGFYGVLSSDINIQDSTLANNSILDIQIDPAAVTSRCDAEITNVTGTNNKPIVYYNTTVSINSWNNNATEIMLCNADNSLINNVTIDNGNQTNNGLIIYSENVNVTNSNINNVTFGVLAWSQSDGLRVENSNFTKSMYGVYGYELDTSIINNTIFNSNEYGVLLYLTDDLGNNNITSSNFINTSVMGVYLYGNSDNNIITNCTFNGDAQSIGFYTGSENNTIYYNTIKGATGLGGIYFWGDCSGNKIYNNFLNNTVNYYVNGASYENFFNTTKSTGTRIYSSGTQIGGNYWAFPNGTGYSETCTDTNKDGFCDDYYNITIGNIDYLPLSDGYETPVPPNKPTLNAPLNNSINQYPVVTLNVTVTDDNGDIMNISFYGRSNDTTMGNNYIYAGGTDVFTVKQYNQTSLAFINQTDNFTSVIGTFFIYEDYIYTGGYSPNSDIFVYNKNTLAYVGTATNGTTSAGYTYAIWADENYIFQAGEEMQRVRQFNRTSLAYINQTDTYGGTVWVIKGDSNYIYVGGVTSNTVKRYNKTSLVYIDQTADYGDTIRGMQIDDNYIYAGGYTTQTVRKYNKSSLSYINETTSYGGIILTISMDSSYLYVAGGRTGLNVKKYDKNTLTFINNTQTYGDNIYTTDIDDNYLYAGGCLVQAVFEGNVQRYNKTNLMYIDAAPNYGGNIYKVWSTNNTFGSQDYVLLGTATNIANGSYATFNWTGLDYETTYNWYATVTDGTYTNTSDIWSFTTGTIGTNFTIWSGSAWVDHTERDIKFRCTSTQTNCEPVNQNVGISQSIYRVCNSGTLDASVVYMVTNQTFVPTYTGEWWNETSLSQYLFFDIFNYSGTLAPLVGEYVDIGNGIPTANGSASWFDREFIINITSVVGTTFTWEIRMAYINQTGERGGDLGIYTANNKAAFSMINYSNCSSAADDIWTYTDSCKNRLVVDSIDNTASYRIYKFVVDSNTVTVYVNNVGVGTSSSNPTTQAPVLTTVSNGSYSSNMIKLFDWDGTGDNYPVVTSIIAYNSSTRPAAPTGIIQKVDDDYTTADATTLTTANQTIHGQLDGGACINVSSWADYDNPTSGGFFTISSYVIGTITETCNGIDDNLNLLIDESWSQLGKGCAVGIGKCYNQGFYVCTEDETNIVCGNAPKAPNIEICDGADNDCDSQIDEGVC